MTAPARYILARPPGLRLDAFARRSGLHPDMVRRLVALGLLRCQRDAGGELLAQRQRQVGHRGVGLGAACGP